MTRFGFGDWVVVTDLPLRCLPRPSFERSNKFLGVGVVPALEPRRRIRRWDHRWKAEDGSTLIALATVAGRFLIRFPSLCDFLLDPFAREISIESARKLDPDELEHALLDQLLPRVLAEFGELSLHASAVRLDAGLLLFVGESGRGKSTL
ncbi:MAG: hypothetical protein ABI588_09980, partial [Arenimonas sp.]